MENMMHTLYLDPETWDLQLDLEGNIAFAKDPYSKAQDVASAIRLFDGELYYNTSKGIPYFDEILGKKQSFSLYQKRLVDAALTVPGVLSAEAGITREADRAIGGAVRFTDEDANTYEVRL